LTPLTITSSTFTSSFAVNGSVFNTFDRVPLSLDSVTIIKSYAADKGGIGYFLERSTEIPNPPIGSSDMHEVSIVSTSISDQYSLKEGGSFYIESDQIS
jgi:hypothetical protein